MEIPALLSSCVSTLVQHTAEHPHSWPQAEAQARTEGGDGSRAHQYARYAV